VLEATAFRCAEVAEAMQEDSGVRLKTLRVDGGGSQNGFLMQLQSDALGVLVERPKVSETTALGAACLAGLGVGVFSSRKDVAQAWALSKRWTPKWKLEERTRALGEWRAFVEKARGLYA
jgi:glycerol kinase